MSLNKVMLLGRLGQDPEVKYTPSGATVCKFSLATSESWADKGGQKQERTTWHNIVVWGKLAELCNQYLSKGRQAFVEGRLQTRTWTDKDGVKRYATDIVASTVQFIGGAPKGNNSYDSGYDQSPDNGKSGIDAGEDYNVSSDPNFASEDIPF